MAITSMARIFTIDFEYKGNSHTAVVSMWSSNPQGPMYQALIYDPELAHLVPEGVLRFSMATDGVAAGDERMELVHCLQSAVKSFLQNVSV